MLSTLKREQIKIKKRFSISKLLCFFVNSVDKMYFERNKKIRRREAAA